jgi:uncharacterized FAD-dependent dehydrogenase
MIRISELKLPLSALPLQVRRAADAPDESEADRRAVAHPVAALTESCTRILDISPKDILELQVFKRSFDARKADLMAVFTVDLQLTTPELEHQCLTNPKLAQQLCASPDMSYRPPRPELQAALQGIRPEATERPVVVGFGPCGMFAALILAQMGLRPIVLERGKAVRQRTQDTWDLWRKRVLHPESNVQFGEGGAGTFSDGKLYSQVRDPRHLGRKVMHELVQAGAPADILFEAHPHIGTFKLVKVVERIRAQIQALGGEIRFGHRVDDVVLEPLPEAGHFQIKGLRF